MYKLRQCVPSKIIEFPKVVLINLVKRCIRNAVALPPPIIKIGSCITGLEKQKSNRDKHFLPPFLKFPQYLTNFPQTKCCITEKLGIITGEARKSSINNGRIEKFDPSIIMLQFSKKEKTLKQRLTPAIVTTGRDFNTIRPTYGLFVWRKDVRTGN